MTRDEGTADRIGWLVLAAAALVLSWSLGFGSVLLLAFAAGTFATAALGCCPLYRLFKFSTNPTFHKTSTPEVRSRITSVLRPSSHRQ
jgi:hypothetical protein